MAKSRSRQRKSRKRQSTFSLRRATSPSTANKPKRKKPVPSMSITELQNMAMSHGIAFGGLTKNQLIEKIQKYQ